MHFTEVANEWGNILSFRVFSYCTIVHHTFILQMASGNHRVTFYSNHLETINHFIIQIIHLAMSGPHSSSEKYKMHSKEENEIQEFFCNNCFHFLNIIFTLILDNVNCIVIVIICILRDKKNNRYNTYILHAIRYVSFYGKRYFLTIKISIKNLN